MENRKKKWFFIVLVCFIAVISGCGQSGNGSEAAGGNRVGADSSAAADSPTDQKDDVQYPTKPISMMVAFSPGGSADNIARLITPLLSEKLGVPIHVDNKPPAQTGENLFSRSKPDGYTIGTMAPVSVASNDLFFDVPYNGQEFEWIAAIVTTPSYMFTSKSGNLTSIEDLSDLAKTRPLKVATTSKYLGSSASAALTLQEKNIPFTFITGYKSNSETITAVVRGEADLVGTSLGSASGFVASGDLVPMLALQTERSEELPDVQSLKDIGVTGAAANSLGSTYFALVAPPKTDPAITKKLNDAVLEVVKDPQFIESAQKSGFFVKTIPQEELKDYINNLYSSYEDAKTILDGIN